MPKLDLGGNRNDNNFGRQCPAGQVSVWDPNINQWTCVDEPDHEQAPGFDEEDDQVEGAGQLDEEGARAGQDQVEQGEFDQDHMDDAQALLNSPIRYCNQSTAPNWPHNNTYSAYMFLPGGPRRRFITSKAARDQMTLDPITKLYMTYDKVPVNHLGNPATQESNDFHIRIQNYDEDVLSAHTPTPWWPERRSLDPTTPFRVDVQWSLGGFWYKPLSSEINRDDEVRVIYDEFPSFAPINPAARPVDTRQDQRVLRWTQATSNQSEHAANSTDLTPWYSSPPRPALNTLPWFQFDASTAWGVTTLDEESTVFNFANEMCSLAFEAAVKSPTIYGEQGVDLSALPGYNAETNTEEAMLTAIPYQDDNITHMCQIMGFSSRNALESEVAGDSYERALEAGLIRNNINWAPRNAWDVLQMAIIILCPAGLENSSARTKQLLSQAVFYCWTYELRMAAYNAVYKSYEYHNFAVEVPYANDFIAQKFKELGGLDSPSYLSKLAAEESQQVGEMISPGFATISSEYNFFMKDYEDAISQPAVPEAVLPNLYLYNLSTDTSPPPPGPNDWQRGGSYEQGEDRHNSYDELLTLNDSMKRVFPRLGGNETQSNAFKNYLKNYALAVTGGVDVDFLYNYNKHLKKDADNYVLPGETVDIIAQANIYKKQFPMFIEYTLPTKAHQGPTLNKLFENTYTTSNVSNAAIEAPSSTRKFDLQTRALILGGNIDNPFSIDEGSLPSYNVVANKASLKIYDWSMWKTALGEPNAIVLENYSEYSDDDDVNNEERKQRALDFITTYVETKSTALTITYSELLEARNNERSPQNQFGGGVNTESWDYNRVYCPTETLLYKVIKSRKAAIAVADQAPPEVHIQSYYLFNTTLTDVIRFVDTQVKNVELNESNETSVPQEYIYEVSAYDIVYGSEFRFRTLNYDIDDPVANKAVFFNYNVETVPNIKVVEYPVLSDWWTYAKPVDGKLQAKSVAGGGFQSPGIPQRDWVGAVSFPPTNVLDRPPLAPIATIVPYKNNSKEILINFEVAIGSARGQSALKYYGLNPAEEKTFKQLSEKQKLIPSLSSNLKEGHIETETNNTEEIRRIEVFRVKDLDTSIQTKRLIYYQFSDKLHRVLDLDEPDPMYGQALAFDFVDQLEPNEKYYYIFRTVDNSGFFSNPSEIHKVELVNNDGVYYPIIGVHEPKDVPTRVPTKRAARFIEVKPSELQSTPFDIPTTVGDITTVGNQIGLINDNENRVENNDFILRITSIDTGRKIDIRLNFIQRIRSRAELNANPTGATQGSGRAPRGSPTY